MAVLPAALPWLLSLLSLATQQLLCLYAPLPVPAAVAAAAAPLPFGAWCSSSSSSFLWEEAMAAALFRMRKREEVF
jgi:hypothetical protein